MRSLTKTGLSFDSSMPLPFDRVAGPFLRPWQSEAVRKLERVKLWQVRTETGQPEPEAEEDSATMRYIRAAWALIHAGNQGGKASKWIF